MTDHLQACPMINLELPVMPPRSRLYPLAPIGLGTPQVEGLTSYLARLTRVHCVPLSKLLKLEIATVLDRPKNVCYDRFRSRVHALNGFYPWTQLTLAALEALTGRNDLRFLTMSPWRHVLGRTKLLRPHLAWCPRCYHEWRQSGQPLYQPLVWALDVVQVCVKHHQALGHCCPNADCQKRLPLINGPGQLGHCPFCHRWLGSGSATTQDGGWDEATWQWQRWVATQLGEVVAAAPNLPADPEAHTLAQNMRMRITSKQIYELERVSGLSASAPHGWMKGTHLPQLALLVRFCYPLELRLLDLFTPPPASQIWTDTDDDDQPGAQSRDRPKVEAVELRGQLERFLSDTQSPPRPASQVAHQLGLSVTTLYQVCPEQHRQIVARYRQYQQIEQRQKRKKLAQDLRAILADDEAPPPSLQAVARRLQINPSTAKYLCPDLCRLIIDRYKTYHATRKQNVRATLQASLTGQEEPPRSVTELAARLGEHPNYLYRHVPALCRAVTERLQTYLHSQQGQQAPEKEMNLMTSAADQSRLWEQFTAIVAAEEQPPPSFVEVARRLGCRPEYLRHHYSDLYRQLRQQQEAYPLSLERRLREILAEQESPPPSLKQVARRLGVNDTTLTGWLPELCQEIVRRGQAYRQAERLRWKLFLDKVLSENQVPPLSLADVARSLDCRSTALQRHFPEASRALVERHQAYQEAERTRVKAILEAILADYQPSPPALKQVAHQLGYEDSKFVRRHFPDLCRQIHHRHQAHRQRTARAELAAVLADDEAQPPPSLHEISRRLGYTANGLKRLCPDLCQVLVEKGQSYWRSQKRAVKQALQALLEDEASQPLPVQALAEEFDYTPETIRQHFPDLTAAVSEKYETYRQERGRQRRRQLDEEVKRLTREIYHQGLDPSLSRVSLRLPQPKMVMALHVQQAWREARQELGLPD